MQLITMKSPMESFAICTDKGISVGQGSSISVENNLIANCSQGVAVKDLSVANIDRNTFYNVAIPVACFEKNVGLGGGLAFVSNSILSNSAIAPYLEDAVSSVAIDYTLSDTDSLLGANNIFANPQFVQPTFNDFELQNNSPALGAGMNDLGEAIDLGSEYVGFEAEPTLVISAIHYHPKGNPQGEFVAIRNVGTQAVNLEGYVLSEAIDYIFPAATIAPNETILAVQQAWLFAEVPEQVFKWSAGKLANSSETIRLTDANGIIVDQVTYSHTAPWPTAADGEGSFLSLVDATLDNHFASSWEAALTVPINQGPEINHQLLVYPNPAHGYLVLQSEGPAIEKVSLLNLLAQPMKTWQISASQSLVLDITDLAEGTYFLQINGQLTGEKIQVQK